MCSIQINNNRFALIHEPIDGLMGHGWFFCRSCLFWHSFLDVSYFPSYFRYIYCMFIVDKIICTYWLHRRDVRVNIWLRSWRIKYSLFLPGPNSFNIIRPPRYVFLHLLPAFCIVHCRTWVISRTLPHHLVRPSYGDFLKSFNKSLCTRRCFRKDESS